MLFRDARRLKGFPKRGAAAPIKLPLPTQYPDQLHQALSAHVETTRNRARDMLYPERIYQEFEGDNATWWNFNPRVQWLMGYLTSHRSQKVLVICTKLPAALQLEQVAART
ncbi:hypothetical protein ACLK1S_00375 [Escherichia coli]